MFEEKITQFWDSITNDEEIDYDDEYVNRILRLREIKRNLDGVKSILDIGGGTGAFSIPLAKMGYDVLHVDLSSKMLEVAKEKAKGLKNIDFLQADARNLKALSDKSYDLVLNFDGPISFSGVKASQVIKESCRVTKKKLLLTVSNKACMSATWLNYSMSTLGQITDSVFEMMESGLWDKSKKNEDQNICGIETLKAYHVEELKDVLIKNRMEVITCRGIGSLTHLYLIHLYRTMGKDKASTYLKELSHQEKFIDLCEKYDVLNPMGPGSFRRAGLLAVAKRKENDEHKKSFNISRRNTRLW